MLKDNELIVNASYKDFFTHPDLMRRDAFIKPNLSELDTLENAHLTRSLALLLRDIDTNKSSVYGIEIKSNGSERSSRIPLVRCSKKSISIWKITNSIDSLEKSVIALSDLINFLKEQSETLYPLPKKILVLKDNELLFSKKDSEYSNFVDNIASKHDIKLFSFEFIKSYIMENKPINLDEIIERSEQSIFTTSNI